MANSRKKIFIGDEIYNGVFLAKPEVVQYAYAFVVPIKYPEHTARHKQ